jgi:hypothetical protein
LVGWLVGGIKVRGRGALSQLPRNLSLIIYIPSIDALFPRLFALLSLSFSLSLSHTHTHTYRI